MNSLLKYRNGLLILLLAVMVGSCETYKEPLGGVPVAELNVLPSPAVPGAYLTQTVYYKVRGETCKPPLPLVILAQSGMQWGGDTKGPVRIAANERIYIEAEITAFKSIGPNILTASCENVISFVPIEGKSYSISQVKYGNDCRAAIAEQSTGAAPSSYIVHPVVGKCRG